MQNPPDNYYDHYPTIALARPVVLGGVPTAPYREVGHSLGALSGLPLIDLDHWLEHHFGSSLWEALHQRGEAAVGETARALMAKALETRPCSLVVLGAAAALVGVPPDRERTALVWLDAAPTALYWTLRQEQLEQAPQPFPCVPFPLERFGQLEPLLGVLRLYAERADLCLEVVEVQETVNQLFAALPRLGGAAVDEFRDA